MVKGSQKGASFEREIAKKLSLWLSHGERDDLLWRTAMSGGRATLKRQAGESAIAQAGDLCSIDEQSFDFTKRFFIEVKHLKDLNLTSFVLRGQGILTKHLDKALSEARAENKSLFFVVRQNRFPTIAILTTRVKDLEPLAHVRDFFVYDFEEFLRAEREIDPE